MRTSWEALLLIKEHKFMWSYMWVAGTCIITGSQAAWSLGCQIQLCIFISDIADTRINELITALCDQYLKLFICSGWNAIATVHDSEEVTMATAASCKSRAQGCWHQNRVKTNAMSVHSPLHSVWIILINHHFIAFTFIIAIDHSHHCPPSSSSWAFT